MSGDLAVALLLFAGSAALVIFSGVFLAKYGDALAELMGWGRLWAGTILVALATSLPELLTNITASVRDLPELAGGNILGSNMVNMLILALVALLFGGAGFFRRIAPEHKPLALTAMSLTGIALILGAFHVRLSFAGVGLASLLMIGAYLGGMRAVYVARPQPPGGSHEAPSPGLPNLRRAWIYFGLASFGVLLAAPTLAISVEQIAESTGLASSFLGVVAVAVVTSMPEISTSIAAVRMGAVDLAIGNLYGSCALNIVLLFPCRSFLSQRCAGGDPWRPPLRRGSGGDSSHGPWPKSNPAARRVQISTSGSNYRSDGPCLLWGRVRRV